MEQSKLILILSDFDYKEHKKFHKFLSSPYFNENEALIRLYEQLKARLEQDLPLTKAILFKALFPATPYDDLKLRHLLSGLLKLVERFLAQRIFESRPELVRLQLLEGLRERFPGKIYEYHLRQAYTYLEKTRLQDTNWFLYRHQLAMEHHEYLMRSRRRDFRSNLQAVVDSLDAYFLLSKLKYSSALLNDKKVLDFDYEALLLEEILTYLEGSAAQPEPAIAIYYQGLLTLREPDFPVHYERLRSLLDEHWQTFQKREARDMYAFAQNYCVRRINQGETNFLEELFNLYRHLLETGLAFEGGYLSPWEFKNIVAVGLRLKTFDWIEDFIQQYAEKIHPDFRDNAYTYNLARLHFYRQEYSKVLSLLQQVEYDDVFYSLDSKVMLLKTYFELEEVEALDSLIDSFRIFLRRNKLISESHQTNYLNLIRFVKKLSKLRQGDTKQWKSLQQQIESTRQIADINWLRNKMEMAAG